MREITEFQVHRFRDGNPNRFIRDTRRNDDDGPSMAVLLTAASDVDALEFTRRPDGLADALEFVRQTDFETQSALIAQHSLSECYRAKVNHVTQTGESFQVQFCRTVRDASVACSQGEHSLEVVALRLPFAFDGPPRGGYGVGIGSTCTEDPITPPERGES